jgi:N-acylneuraminate cytidylyltransferase
MIMECLAIIPARGESKGIPRKNLKKVDGVPLVAHAVRSALAADSITRAVVSTGDEEIAQVAREAGAEIIMRPDSLSGDEAPTEPALLHVLETLVADEGYHPDFVCFIQCTSPLTKADDLDRGIEMLQAQKADCLVSVVPTHDFLWRRTADGSAQAINHNCRCSEDMLQDLPERESLWQFLYQNDVHMLEAAGMCLRCKLMALSKQNSEYFRRACEPRHLIQKNSEK